MSNIINSSGMNMLMNYKPPAPFSGISISFKPLNKPSIIDITNDQEQRQAPPQSKPSNSVHIIDKTKTSHLDRNTVLNNIYKHLITQPNTQVPVQVREPTIRSIDTVAKPVPIITKKRLNLVKKPKTMDASNKAEPVVEAIDDDVIQHETITVPVVEPDILVNNVEQVPVTVKRIIPKKKNKSTIIPDDVDLTTATINNELGAIPIDSILPHKQPLILKGKTVDVKHPTYYMDNRKIYVQKLTELFKPYESEILAQYDTLTCDNRSSSVDFELLTHQKVVREYLNLYSPYRGLLLYHGLGSGKTCTSIAIAEGMKTNKQIFVMTPASLKKNFFNEMKMCGDALYKKNQWWEFIEIKTNIDSNGKPTDKNVNILAKALSLDIKFIMDNKGAWLVNITKPSNFATLNTADQTSVDNQITEMIRSKYKDLNYNGLNDRIIQEITQNNTINPFDNSVIIIDEAHNFVSRIVNKLKSKDSISYKLYNYLMNAENARIVLLSGTPIINHPNEIAILFNILRGYIKTWTIPVELAGVSGVKLNTETILELLDDANMKTYDYVNVSGNELTITRNPYGFINTKKKGVLKGTIKTVKPTTNTTKKIMGGSVILDKYDGVVLNDSGNISDAAFITSVKRAITKGNKYKINENQIQKHNFTALPNDPNDFMQLFVDNDKQISLTNRDEHYIKNVELFQRRILGLTSYFRSALETLLPRIETTETGNIYHIVHSEMSIMQFNKYVEIRKSEVDREKQSKKMNHTNANANAEDVYKTASSYRIFSRAACNFTFPSHIKRPSNKYKEIGDVDDAGDDVDGVEDTVEPIGEPDAPYNEQIETALELLTNGPSIEDPEVKINYLLTENLTKYCSPKFAKIIENIMDENNEGLHLLYSAFRTIEGVGILRRILLENGFAEFKIIYKGSEWVIDEELEDINKPKFVLHTGTESVDEKEIILNIYNGKWDYIPSGISSILRERAESNMMGDIIKLLMITSSGAEGINLLNTRYVHIVEPYWHMVRLDQVVGRARRICSHNALPAELQTVKVFLYISKLNLSDKDNNIELIGRDVSKFDKKTPIATDEALYENSLMKQIINDEFLLAIQQSAVDCNLYKSTSGDVKHKCYNLGVIKSNDFLSYPDIEQDKHIKQDLNVKMDEIVGVKFEYKQKSYVLNKKTNEVYSAANYEQASKQLANLITIGHLIGQGKTQTIKFI